MILAFAPQHNTKGRKDATGAFIPEGRAFLRFHGQDPKGLVLIDNTLGPARMRADVLAALQHSQACDAVAFFCHGFRRGIQFGFRLAQAGELAEAIADACASDAAMPLPVTLYSCDTGRDDDAQRADDLETVGGDGGFAHALWEALGAAGVNARVDGHTTAAHTTRNPDVRRFEGPGGGRYIVPRGDRLWGAWRAALRTDFRFEFPYLTVEQIHARLSG